MKYLGFLRGTRLVAVLTFLGVVAIVAITRQGIFSPGALNAQAGPTPVGGVSTHASLQCSACHAPPFSKQTMADLCLKCHTDVAQELSNPHALHGMLLPKDQPVTCTANCHTEHNGATASISLVSKEHLSGKSTTGYSLQSHKTQADGKTPFSCVDCHPSGLDTFSINTCATCHRQIDAKFMQTHVDDFGQACLQCHDGVETYGKAFDHNQVAFPLQGKHASAACTDCHQGAGSTAALKAAPQACNACHQKDDKHNGAFGQSCGQCHNATDWTQITYDHTQTSYPLTGKHADAACTDCHVNNVLKGTHNTCNACHQKDDKHNGALGQNCAQCHNTTDWTQTKYDHGQTSYPLTGKHVSTDCTNCHANNLWKGTPNTCNACHQRDDKHEGTLGANCAACHNTSDWKQTKFDHSSTSYQLTGKHADVACADCHTSGPPSSTPNTCNACHQKDDKHNGTLGSNCTACHNTTDWKQTKFDHSSTSYTLTGKHISASCDDCHTTAPPKNTPTSCNACHQKDDQHNGRLGTNCIQCHNTTDWKQATVDHSKTAYPLTGAHVNVDCTSCHVNGVYQGTPKDCYSCHRQDDQHQGRLGANCVQCHNTTDWKQATIDHSKTAYPLTGAHVSVDCTSCHVNGVYQGTPKDCYSCHRQDDQHQGRLGANCVQCHNTTDWKQATIDHSKTAYPLTGAHVSVDCTSCHVNNVFKGTPTDCYSCHKTDDAHKGSFGQNCAQCHNTTDWKQATVDHSKTSFPLTGAHVSVNCTSCHANGVYQGTPTACNACHNSDATQFHTAALAAQNCASCHNTTDWTQATINHSNTDFALTGAHTTVTCTSCHVNNVLKGTPTDCYSCHKTDDTHKGANGTDCSACHNTTDWSQATVDHSKTSFPLTGAHTPLTCTSCHVNGVYAGTPTACSACHKSDATPYHSATVIAQNCATCHSTTNWTTATINHTNTPFPLTGTHTSVACASCHKNNVFNGTPTDCYSCHKNDDTHNGSNGTACASCHNTADWTQATVDHSTTAFPLTGAHSSVDCVSCHGNGVYAGTPTACISCHSGDATQYHSATVAAQNCATCHNTADWTQATVDHSSTAFALTGAHTTVTCISCHVNNVFKGTPSDCYYCHKNDDAHNGSNGTACASCHNTTDWTQATVDHSQTAFPLTGAHTLVACSSCHVNGVYAGTPTTCASCHGSDATQYHTATIAAQNCATCHNTTNWTTATINHSNTAFALTGSHITATCTSCHVNNVFKGTPKACSSCHSSDATQYHSATIAAQDCATCHNTTNWTQATINHSITLFPLVGRHTSASCTACHVNNVFNGTPTDCYSCHAKDDDHNGRNGTNCGQCHNPSGWDNTGSSATPTRTPTPRPSTTPSGSPTPTRTPTPRPTATPSGSPTPTRTPTPRPTATSALTPTRTPTPSPTPTVAAAPALAVAFVVLSAPQGVQPIADAYCIYCHGGSGELALAGHAGATTTVSGRFVAAPGDPANGVLSRESQTGSHAATSTWLQTFIRWIGRVLRDPELVSD